ncbi:MFS transporter [Paenibacillus sp. 481]|uniref:MFS transporter n=1 Tax=Paenibacillus sp. 481 TaxID=2835869 RepID=UPI001E5CBF26|nr:MFS transporter [Paenibacillus sp. 481]UHA72325.1 MFS transporter [Paenibacillus sp. 481]
MKARLNGQLLLLLVVFGLFSLANALSGTFVNVFLWKVKSEFTLIGWFAFSQQIAIGLMFYTAGKWVKEGNKLNCLRLGIGLASLFYAAVLWLGKAAVYYIWPLGLTLGAALGAFWLAFNVIYFEVTDANNRDLFNGSVGLVGAGCGMIAPWASGFLISQLGGDRGYPLIFTISLGVFIGAGMISFWLERRPPEQHYDWLIPFVQWKKKNSPWRAALPALAAQGIRDGVFAFLVGLIVYIATTNELKLGSYTLITSAVSLISFYAVGRWIKEKYRISGMFVGAIAMGCAVVPLFVQLQYSSLLTFGIITSLFSPLFVVPMTSATFDLLGVDEQSVQHRVELTVTREFGLLVGRIVSILAFIVFVQWRNDHQAIVIFLAVVGFAPVITTWLMRPILQQKLKQKEKSASHD